MDYRKLGDTYYIRMDKGDEINFLKFGTGKNTLVILPGLSVQSVLLAAPAIAAQYERLTKDFTVYLFDRRTNPPPRYSVQDMADDTARAMIKLGLSDVCLFGASQGGMMAMAIAAKKPLLVQKLALGSTACRIDPKRAAVIEEWIALAKEKDAKALYLSFGEKVYPPHVFSRYRDGLIKMAKNVTDTELARFVTLAEGCRGFDIKDQIKKIRCPVLAIGDRTDAVLGIDATLEIKEAQRENPDFALFLYNGYGHAAYDTAPDYVERLYDFFIGEKDGTKNTENTGI